MMKTMCPRLLALALLAPAAAPVLTSVERGALHARCDPSLGSLRAGVADRPAPLAAKERSAMAAAQTESRSLGALRGGATDDELMWLLVGAGIVILLILIL